MEGEVEGAERGRKLTRPAPDIPTVTFGLVSSVTQVSPSKRLSDSFFFLEWKKNIYFVVFKGYMLCKEKVK